MDTCLYAKIYYSYLQKSTNFLIIQIAPFLIFLILSYIIGHMFLSIYISSLSVAGFFSFPPKNIPILNFLFFFHSPNSFPHLNLSLKNLVQPIFYRDNSISSNKLFPVFLITLPIIILISASLFSNGNDLLSAF